VRTIGLIGGMSWESTALYYRLVNEAVRKHLGGLHSAKLILYSVDFHEVESLQRSGDWAAAGRVLADAARAVEAAGAEVIALCSNTMHKVAPAVEAAVSIPLLHIADATAEAIKAAGVSSVGLLGTRFTMEETFYRDRLGAKHGLSVQVPSPEDRELVHRVIYDELCLGTIEETSRSEYVRVLSSLADRGAEAVILGCTEITLLIDERDSPLPLFDTTRLHADAAVEWALGSVRSGQRG
jgi:aspartate racemase